MTGWRGEEARGEREGREGRGREGRAISGTEVTVDGRLNHSLPQER